MADYLTNTTDLTAVADAIRSKGGTSAALVYPSGFVSAIEAISTGGDGGATEYTIESILYPIGAGFDVTSAGLTSSDFTLDANTRMWIEFAVDKQYPVWLDSNDDDDFLVTIPSGTIASAVGISGDLVTFAFSVGSGSPFGWFKVQRISSGECDIAAYGDLPEYGCIASTSGYGTASIGAPQIAVNTFAGELVLHILKYS